MKKTAWKLMKATDILKLKRNRCRFCIYAGRSAINYDDFGMMTCDYILIEGHSRGCPPDRCDKFVWGERISKNGEEQLK